MLVSPMVFILSLIGGGTVRCTGFGLIYEGRSALNPTAIFLMLILTLSGVVAYGILWGKDWAVRVGILHGWLALVTTILAFFFAPNPPNHPPIEIFFLLPFLVILYLKKGLWRDYKPH